MSERFEGRLLRRGDEGYEEARVGRVFNARRPDRYPAAVLLAESDQDLVEAVRLAREEGLQVSVRSGGHSWAAWGVRDDALLVDLGLLKDMTYDEATGVVSARTAVRGALDLAPFLEERHRAFPGGHCESVGIGGFVLQGGQGWNSRSLGWACESLVAIDVVTADGELVRADAEQNSDLWWAARGAGPGFPGLIARFHLQTYPQPAVMVQDTWTFRLEDTAPVLTWLHEVLPTLDATVEPVLAATRLPDVPLHPGVERPEGTVLLVHTTCAGDSLEQVEARLAAFDAAPAGIEELGHDRSETSIPEENAAQAAQNPENHRYAVDCTWTDATADQLAPVLEQLWRELPTTHSFSIWYGWAPTRPLPDMAFSVEANVYLATYLIYTDAADDDAMRDLVHSRTEQLAALDGRGVYLGDTDFSRRTDRFLTDENFERLEEIRAERDPEGRFVHYLVHDRARLNIHDGS